MNALGFLLVVLSGAGLGLSAAGEIRRTLRHTEEAIRLADRMRFFICVRHLSIPEALERVGSEFSFLGKRQFEDQIREKGFSAFWKSAVRDSEYPEIPSGILSQIGDELSAGEDPERVFAAFLPELKEYKDMCLSRMRESAKLYPVIGLSCGFLIAIVLL